MLGLGLVFFKLFPFPLDFGDLCIVLLPDKGGLLLQRVSELGGVFDLAPTNQHLRVHGLDFLLKDPPLLLGVHKLL